MTTDAIPRDSRGQFIADLTKDDFEILEDGVPQEIARFERLENLPIHVAILLDVSASTESNLAQAKAAASLSRIVHIS